MERNAYIQDILNYTGRPDRGQIPREIYGCRLEFVPPMSAKAAEVEAKAAENMYVGL